MSALDVFLVGLGVLGLLIAAIVIAPRRTTRGLAWIVFKAFYRIRVRGRENLPKTGGALIVANHVSWIDGFLLHITAHRWLRMFADPAHIKVPFFYWLTRKYQTVEIDLAGGPKALMRGLKEARAGVIAGDVVCMFPEGGITRSGQLQEFHRGFMKIVEGTETPVIPVYLDELWGSVFSFYGGKFFSRMPRRWRYPVTITFGEPIYHPRSAYQIRQAVARLGVESMEGRKSKQLIPPRQLLRQCKSSRSRSKVADSSGVELTGGKLLAGAMAFKRVLQRHVLAADEKMVGVFLPPSVGGVLANAALSLLKRVPVNLNYTLSEEVVNFCIQECGITHVLSSRRFLEQRPMNLDVEVVYLEDLKEQISGTDKLIAAVQAFLVPAIILDSVFGLKGVSPDDLNTVIFTSGSTGEPKGVMLSHDNIRSNTDAVDQLFHLTKQDVLLGVLPFFHSFGFTGTLWLPLVLEPKCVYHFNPLDGRTVGKLCGKHGVTIIIATPTFLRTYLKRCDTEQMSKLNLVIAGAEKLPADVVESYQNKYGVTPVEGYGTTELSPVAAFNVPADRVGNTDQTTNKLGTVGRVLPGAMAKIVDPDTGEDLGLNVAGLLKISGPNVMQGYLNQPEKTAELIQDGWYNTGDMAMIDDEGFITITGRQSRFSKIGGEMVPHIKIEEAISSIVANDGSEDATVQVAVTAVPHETKGERLIVLHTKLAKSIDEIRNALSEAGLPNLWIPAADGFLETDEIPLLGTGKLDLKAIKEMALTRTTVAQ